PVEAGRGILQQLAVELDLLDLLGEQIEEGRLGGARGEADRGLGAERPLVRGEVQADVVGVGAEERGAASRFVTREVLGSHGLHPATRGARERSLPAQRWVRSRSQV